MCQVRLKSSFFKSPLHFQFVLVQNILDSVKNLLILDIKSCIAGTGTLLKFSKMEEIFEKSGKSLIHLKHSFRFYIVKQIWLQLNFTQQLHNQAKEEAKVQKSCLKFFKPVTERNELRGKGRKQLAHNNKTFL